MINLMQKGETNPKYKLKGKEELLFIELPVSYFIL